MSGVVGTGWAEKGWAYSGTVRRDWDGWGSGEAWKGAHGPGAVRSGEQKVGSGVVSIVSGPDRFGPLG